MFSTITLLFIYPKTVLLKLYCEFGYFSNGAVFSNGEMQVLFIRPEVWPENKRPVDANAANPWTSKI